MTTEQQFQALLSAANAATGFLKRYVEGARGYTTQDAQAGIRRLQALCDAIAHAECPSVRSAQAASTIVRAAELWVEQARDRLARVEAP
jgi:hypothetical protein